MQISQIFVLSRLEANRNCKEGAWPPNGSETDESTPAQKAEDWLKKHNNALRKVKEVVIKASEASSASGSGGESGL